MKKRFLLITMVFAVGLGGSGCGLSGGSEFETITDAGISNVEEIDVSEAEALTTEKTTEKALEITESTNKKFFLKTSESSGDAKELESPEATELPEETEATSELEEITESNLVPVTEATTEMPREEPAREVTEATAEELEEEGVVAYDPNYVVALAIAKTKAYGKISVWENLDLLLAEGKITREEYVEYYPYDGLENSYYSVFIETDLSKASTTSGRCWCQGRKCRLYCRDDLFGDGNIFCNLLCRYL